MSGGKWMMLAAAGVVGFWGYKRKLQAEQLRVPLDVAFTNPLVSVPDLAVRLAAAAQQQRPAGPIGVVQDILRLVQPVQ